MVDVLIKPNQNKQKLLIIRLFCVKIWTLVGVEGLTPLKLCSRCIQQPTESIALF